jgi:hypothetical protein
MFFELSTKRYLGFYDVLLYNTRGRGKGIMIRCIVEEHGLMDVGSGDINLEEPISSGYVVPSPTRINLEEPGQGGQPT